MDTVIRRPAGGSDRSWKETEGASSGGGVNKGRPFSGGGGGGWCSIRRASVVVLVVVLLATTFVSLQLHRSATQKELEAEQYVREIDRLSILLEELDQRNMQLAEQYGRAEQHSHEMDALHEAQERELDSAKAAAEGLLRVAEQEKEELRVHLHMTESQLDHLQTELNRLKDDHASTPRGGGAAKSSASTHPPGFDWRLQPASTLQKRPPRRLAVIIPHAIHQENRLSEFYARSHTAKNVPACNQDLPYTQYRDLWVYSNKLVGGTPESNRKKTEEYKQNMKKVSMYNCYRSVTFISANLTDEQDPYPTKTRNNGVIADLFFRIFEMDQFRKNYDYFFLMESDVQPLRPYWLDNMYEHAEYALEDFWVKGSIYRGPATPKEYCMGIYWGCGDHFNGNSMYRLGDPVFDSFLRFARDTRVDPGKSVGINHDAQIVRVLRDPAVWRFYQRYAHKFVYTQFVQHRPPLVMDDLRRTFNNTFIVHQASNTAEVEQEGELEDIYLDRTGIVLNPS